MSCLQPESPEDSVSTWALLLTVLLLTMVLLFEFLKR